MFYGHERDQREETFGKDTFSYSVDVLGGLTYQFHVRAVTIKPGKNASVAVNVPEYGRFSFFFFFYAYIYLMTQKGNVQETDTNIFESVVMQLIL